MDFCFCFCLVCLLRTGHLRSAPSKKKTGVAYEGAYAGVAQHSALSTSKSRHNPHLTFIFKFNERGPCVLASSCSWLLGSGSLGLRGWG